MKYITIITIIIVLSSCKGPKILSDTSITHQDIKVTERVYKFKTDHLAAVDTTDLSRLLKRDPIIKTDKATGIRITTSITPDNQLVTQVDVPPITKTVIVADTTKVITNDRKVVQEERYSLQDKIDNLIDMVVWIMVIFLVISLLLKLIKPI